jgi:hypothetical protein
LPLATFVVLEGASSLVLLTQQVAGALRPRRAEEASTEYDAGIGWMAKKSFEALDWYAPGVALHTNARGFRGTDVIDDAVPAGMRRVVCSGDSFTLGYGVGDRETWCAQLATPGWQAVNMGQGAYGLDQAYLWYARDARAMAHDVHVVAVITEDFRRMESDRFRNRGKPRLAVRGDSLVVLGVPVSRGSIWWEAGLFPAVRSLRTAQLAGRLTSSAAPQRQSSRATEGQGTRFKENGAVVARVVAELARLNAAKASTLLLVYLPVDTDFQTDASGPWREAMRSIADSLGVPLIDLIPAQRSLGREAMQELYIADTDAAFASSARHFTVAGNRWAATLIRAVLDSVLAARAPDVRPR